MIEMREVEDIPDEVTNNHCDGELEGVAGETRSEWRVASGEW